jgi:hypothetical protein
MAISIVKIKKRDLQVDDKIIEPAATKKSTCVY